MARALQQRKRAGERLVRVVLVPASAVSAHAFSVILILFREKSLTKCLMPLGFG